METKTKVAIVLPTYDEAENLEKITEQILEVCAGANIAPKIVVIDDASPDGTGKIADKLRKADPGHFIVIRREERGRGTATTVGFREAIKTDPDYILEIDADFSHDPKDIPRLVEGMAGADVVLGSRYAKGGKVLDSPISRRVLSRLANVYNHWMLGLDIKDITGGFKCYTSKAAKAIDFDNLCSPPIVYYGPEILFQLAKKGFRIKEIPITFTNRIKGKSKLSIPRIIKNISRGPVLLMRLRFSK